MSAKASQTAGQNGLTSLEGTLRGALQVTYANYLFFLHRHFFLLKSKFFFKTLRHALKLV